MWRRLAFIAVYGWPFFVGLLVAALAHRPVSVVIVAASAVGWLAWAVWFVPGWEARLKAHWRLPLLIWSQPDVPR